MISLKFSFWIKTGNFFFFPSKVHILNVLILVSKEGTGYSWMLEETSPSALSNCAKVLTSSATENLETLKIMLALI